MILGISGKMGAGKDTAADILVKDHGFIKLSFATPIKEICSVVFNLPMEYFYDRVLKDKPFDEAIILTEDYLNSLCDEITERGVTVDEDTRAEIITAHSSVALTSPRNMLQYVGTDIGRNEIHTDIWLLITKNILRNHEGSVVIADCRFPNERAMIKELEGRVAIVKRPNLDLLYTNDNTSHISENNLGAEDDYDFIFNNSGLKGTFEEEVSLWYKYRKDY